MMQFDWEALGLPENILKSTPFIELQKVLGRLDTPMLAQHCHRCWLEGYIAGLDGMADVAALVAANANPLVFIMVFNEVIEKTEKLLTQLQPHTNAP